LKDQTKGYILAFISVLAVSNVYIFSKAALNEISLPQFGFYWFGFGIIWISLYALKKKSFAIFKNFDRYTYLKFFTLGVIEVVATTFFFKAINTIPNPAITSFLGNISPVFVLTLSFFFLKERLNRIELIGVLLAITGAFIIGYKGGTDLKTMFIDGTQYIVYSALLSSTISVISKKYIHTLSPVLIALNRTFFLLTFSTVMMFVQHKSFIIPESALKNILFGSILGPFLTVILGLLALQYIDLSKKSMISSTKSLFILLGAYLYFGQFPKIYEIFGGILSISGVLLIITGRMKAKRKDVI
jgi:drug/metabolite transporter (DMT)-like permease